MATVYTQSVYRPLLLLPNLTSEQMYVTCNCDYQNKMYVLWIKVLTTHLWVNDISEADMVVREDT